MPIVTDASEKQLQLEGATLATVAVVGDTVRLGMLGAGIYHESSFELYEAILVVTDSSFTGHLALPSEITGILISLSGVGSWGVFVPFPFSIDGHCQIEVSLRSGEHITVNGSSCRIELSQGTCHVYALEPHNGA